MKTDITAQDSLYHPTLVDLLEWLEDATGVEFIQTSTYRDGDPGVHGTIPLRGCDLRCPLPSLGVFIATLINTNWQYDPNRLNKKCCIYHDVGRGRHLHLQVHEYTVRK